MFGNASIQVNPFATQFDTAIMFLKTTTHPGTIKLTAMTPNMGSQSITLESKTSVIPLRRGIVAGQKSSRVQVVGQTQAESEMSDGDSERQNKVTPK